MSADKSKSLSSDSVAAGYGHRNDWLKSTPLPVVQPIYNSSIYFLPSSAAAEAMISFKVMSLLYKMEYWDYSAEMFAARVTENLIILYFATMHVFCEIHPDFIGTWLLLHSFG